MARPNQLPEGHRVSLTLGHDLIKTLTDMAKDRHVPLSIIVEDLLRKGLQEPSARKEDLDRKLPKGWTAMDLRKRLIDLRMRQQDLADALTRMLNHPVSSRTISSWMMGNSPFPEWSRKPIQMVLKEWDPSTNTTYRLGSRSPIA